MNTTKTTLIQNSLKLLGDNPNHTFFAVTIRPNEDFLRRFPYSTRTQITEDIIQNLITKYDAHLISHPNKPQNHHLKIISHNSIETKTRFGSPDIPHSHGIWGIHDTHLEKWSSTSFHDRILELGSYKYEDQNYPLRKVIHSIERVSFTTNLMDKTSPEGWLDYAYKWSGDNDPTTDWSFIHSPFTNNQKTNKEIWHEPYPTNPNLLRQLQTSNPISKRAYRRGLSSLPN
jgi:hypothetical protein